MGSVRAELLKLKRSMSAVVVVVLPLAAVLTGTATTLASGRPLEAGWHTLWLRVVVLYGLFPQAVGIAALASLVWRVEHRGGNWNALVGRDVASLQVVLGKAVVLVALAAAMQVVVVAGTVLAGTLVFGLPGVLPGRYLLAAAVVVVTCAPVAAVQSALPMLMRSFAAPVAVALLGAVGSVAVLLSGIDPLIAVVPYALLARATQLGTGVFADAGVITPATVAGLVASAVALTVVAVAATTARLEFDLPSGKVKC